MRELEHNVQQKIATLTSLTKEYRDARLALRTHVSPNDAKAKGKQAAYDMDGQGDEREGAYMKPNGTVSPSPRPSKRQRLAMLSAISSATSGAIRAAEEKVGLAVTAYEWVDRHIRRLDSDLQKSESSLLLGLRAGTEASRGVRDALGILDEAKVGESDGGGGGGGDYYDDDDGKAAGRGDRGGVDDDDSVVGAPEAAVMVFGRAGRKYARSSAEAGAAAVNRSRGARPQDTTLKTAVKKKATAALARNDGSPGAIMVPDMAIDPNEPRYCYCNQVSYGDMVACDHEDCPREWFHYSCVGLSNPPKGKWYCLFCTPPGFRGSGSIPPHAPCVPAGYKAGAPFIQGSASSQQHGGSQHKRKR
ncbi:hypothetical protein FA10DRAFT_269142 [Acaromyces ingoldii]|uniref:Chromatin modification-related protein n=1 Tax=Acaromyces ingoldii TaxID=215250 RepID=A0A316YGW8_9BASI|nr:hypothetical protein FA10DRAFT_269142 [Acaromyces ingoldii]PWN87858.1 hypothetical protein FA10DRAFT_269142 [Acaromyces ingoldii]